MSRNRILAALVFIGGVIVACPADEPMPATDTRAVVTIVLPTDAELLVDGVLTKQTGATRSFTTPVLEKGKVYHYNLVARWKDGDRQIEQKRQVDVSAGTRVRVDFVKNEAPADASDPTTDDKDVIASKSAPRPSAASVNFRKQLNLPFPTLRTLGSRIDSARREHDAVALANAASELANAEKVSGKQASLTSMTLMNEAAELAILKRQEKELQAVAAVNEQIATAQDNLAILRKSIALSQAQAKADTDAVKQNQEPTWKPRKVTVNNYTTQHIDVYVNGYYKVSVLPGMTQVFYIEHRWNPTVLTGYGDEDNGYPWKRIILGRFDSYTWNLN